MGIWGVKTTIEIDDALYREAKALGAMTGRKMKDLVSEGLQQVLHGLQEQPVEYKVSMNSSVAELHEWFKAADQAIKKAPPGPTARELLEQDRNRLETL